MTGLYLTFMLIIVNSRLNSLNRFQLIGLSDDMIEMKGNLTLLTDEAEECHQSKSCHIELLQE